MEPVRQDRATVANIVALLAGGLAAAFCTWYLAPGFAWTLLNLSLALAILLWPLRPQWPLSRQRLRRVAVWWVAGGLLGGYVFGVSVFVAGVVVAIALAVESLVRGGSNETWVALAATGRCRFFARGTREG